MKHYIAMNGSYGCIPDACYVLKTRKDAVDTMIDQFDLSRAKARELRQRGSLSFGSGFGADYCEVLECDCAEPWIHDEQSTEDEWS